MQLSLQELQRSAFGIIYFLMYLKTHLISAILQVQKKLLRIREARLKDTGFLTCKGINGFGSVTVRVELLVSDPRHGLSPVFSEAFLAQPVHFRRRPEDSFRIECEALGLPTPEINWLTEVGDGRAFETAVLHLPSLRVEDSGVYTCRAANAAGQVRRDISLLVEPPPVELPTIRPLANRTVRAGQPVRLHCEVESSRLPEIQWLRDSAGEEREYSLQLANMKLVHAGPAEVTAGAVEHRFHSTLSLVPSHGLEGGGGGPASGAYVCLATNPSGGFSYRVAYLTVLPSDDRESHNIPSLAIVLSAVLVATAVLVASLLLCIVRSVRKSVADECRSQYSVHIYDVPNLGGGHPPAYSRTASVSDTATTPLSAGRGRSASPYRVMARNQAASGGGPGSLNLSYANSPVVQPRSLNASRDGVGSRTIYEKRDSWLYIKEYPEF